jgi:hypothetical protein
MYGVTRGGYRQGARRRVATVALGVMLFALVVYRTEAGVDEPRERDRRRTRASRPAGPQVGACEMVGARRPPYAIDYRACPWPVRRRPVGRLTRFRPDVSPYSRN